MRTIGAVIALSLVACQGARTPSEPLFDGARITTALASTSSARTRACCSGSAG